MPWHFDPFCFIITVISLLVIYKEYISNHYYKIQLMDIKSSICSADNKMRPTLNVRFRNVGM